MSSTSGSTSRLAALALVVLAAIAGCATSPRLAAPEVRAAAVSVIVLDLPRVRLGIDLALDNPNAVELTLAGLTAGLDVEGERAARATLARPVTLAARATTRVTLDVTGDLALALAGAARSMSSGGPLRYELSGEAELGDGRRIPFRRAGTLALR